MAMQSPKIIVTSNKSPPESSRPNQWYISPPASRKLHHSPLPWNIVPYYIDTLPSPLGTWAYTGNTWNDLALLYFYPSPADITSVPGGYDYTHSASLMHAASGIGFYFYTASGWAHSDIEIISTCILFVLVSCRLSGCGWCLPLLDSRLFILSCLVSWWEILDLPWNCICMYETCLREEVVCMHCSRVWIWYPGLMPFIPGIRLK